MQTCTLRDLVPEGAAAANEADQDVARLKSSADLVKAIEAAVRFYEKPPAQPMTVETHWSDIWLSADDWAEAFEAPEPGTPHNEARGQIWEELITILVDKHDGDAPEHLLRRSLRQNEELRATFSRAWPLLEAADLVADLWSVPAYLRMCAPWLSPDDVRKLQRRDAHAWTVSEVMAEAEPVIRAVLPDANVPTSIRSSGLPVMHGPASDLDSILGTWLAAHAEGIGCVIGDPAFPSTSRIRSLTPELSKGLEFDLVVLVDPEAFGTGIEGAVSRPRQPSGQGPRHHAFLLFRWENLTKVSSLAMLGIWRATLAPGVATSTSSRSPARPVAGADPLTR